MHVGTGKYISETTWNEDSVGDGVTGGGISTVFARPEYQRGVPGIGRYRGVPDVSRDADPLTGVPIVASIFGGTYIIPVGGTSVGAPAWAGLAVLFNQYAGKRLGFLNDAFYRILKSKSYTSPDRAAHVLSNDDKLKEAQVLQRYEELLIEMAEVSASSEALTTMLTTFHKVTASYWSGLFHCYDVPGPPSHQQ